MLPLKELKFERKKKPKSVGEWKRLLPKGLYYTARQVARLAVIKTVTARRWLQHGVGHGILEMKESGIIKRFRVKENVTTKSSKPGSQKDPKGIRKQKPEDIRGIAGDIPEGIRSGENPLTEEGRDILDQSSTVSSEEKLSRKSWRSNRKVGSD